MLTSQILKFSSFVNGDTGIHREIPLATRAMFFLS